MTQSQCNFQLSRLAKGFNVKLSSLQQEAFFDRLKGHDVRDFTEAVTTLLCAPYFPRSIDLIHETTVSAKEKRLEEEKAKRARQEAQAFGQAKTLDQSPIAVSFAELDKENILLILHHDHEGMQQNIERWLKDPEHEAWARKDFTEGSVYANTYDYLWDLMHEPKKAFAVVRP